MPTVLRVLTIADSEKYLATYYVSICKGLNYILATKLKAIEIFAKFMVHSRTRPLVY